MKEDEEGRKQKVGSVKVMDGEDNRVIVVVDMINKKKNKKKNKDGN